MNRLIGVRGDVITKEDVQQAINRNEGRILAAKVREVRVIVKRFSRIVHLPDGSNGDNVVACIDPKARTVMTVMLQRSNQIAAKSRSGDVLYI
jgi:hypothetical protein